MLLCSIIAQDDGKTLDLVAISLALMLKQINNFSQETG